MNQLMVNQLIIVLSVFIDLVIHVVILISAWVWLLITRPV